MRNTTKFLRIIISAFTLIICVQAPKPVFGWSVDYTFATSAKCEEYNNQRKECNSHFGCYHNDSSATISKSTCKVCPAGKTCPDKYVNDVAPETCPAGYVCPQGTFYGKEPKCDSGYYCPAGSSEQTICPAGNYCDGGATYYQCAAGKYQDQTGQTSCKSCTSGTYQDQKGQTSCKTCSKGYKCNGTMQTSQTACTAGTYQDQTGQYTCKSCPVNKVCPSTATITPQDCPTKYPKSDGGAANQSQCYYQASAGKRYSTSDGGEVNCNSGLSSAGYCPGGGTKIYYQSTINDGIGRTSCPLDTIYSRTVSAPVAASSASECYVSCSSGAITGGTKTPYQTKINAAKLGTSWNYGACAYTVSCNTGYNDTSSYPAGSQYTMNPVCTEHEYEIYLYPRKPANASKDIVPATDTYIKLGNYKYTQTATLTNPFTLEGWTFSHWTYNDNGDGSGTQYLNNAKVSQLTTNSVEAEFFTQWTPNKYTITWNLDGGEPDNWTQCQKILLANPGYTITEDVTVGGTAWNPTYTYTYSGTITATYDNYLPSIHPYCQLYKDGYTFNGIVKPANGWGQGTVYYDENYNSKIWDLMEDTTLKVKWEPNVIPVTLNPGNYTFVQNVLPDKIELKYGTGWYTEGASSSGLPPRTNITKIPIVSGKVFNGFYYNDDQMIENDGDFITSNMTATLFTSGSYTFNAQYTDCTCSGSNVSECTATGTTTGNKCQYRTKCNSGYSINGGRDTQGVTTYYNWTANNTNASNTINCSARTFIFTFNANGGSVTNGSRTDVVYDSVPENLTEREIPQRTGYTFAGYSAAQDSTSTMYFNASGKFVHNSENGNKWQRTSDTTMYAHWQANTYTVTLNSDGADSGKEGTRSVRATYDSVLPTITTTPQKTGRDFGGYFSGTNCTGKKYINANGTATTETWTTDSDATLYACWIPDAITIELDENGADLYFLPDSQKKLTLIYGINYYPYGTTYDKIEKTSPVTQLAQIPIKTEYVFTGFYYGNTQVYSQDGALNKGMTQLVLSDSEFIARYEACTCTAGNHSTCGVDLTTEDNECQYAITCDSGYHVNGKGNNVLNDSVTGEAGESAYTSDACIARTFTVTLNDDYGTGGLASITVTYDAKPSKIQTLPTRTGYTFLGYYDANNGEGGTKYFDANGEFVKGEKWNKVGSEELYAHWQANTYTVTLNSDGADSGKEGTPSVRATYDSDMPDITVPQKTGHTFQGYYTERNGQGKPYYGSDGTSANTWDIAEDKTLYAKWLVNAYVVSFERNCKDGDGTMEPQLGRKYGDRVALPKNIFTCGHMVFIGWNTIKEGGGVSFADESRENITTGTSPVTLYAQWLGCAAGCYCPESYNIIECPNADDDASGGQKCCKTCPNLFTSEPGSTQKNQCFLNGINGTIILTDEMGAEVNYTIPANVKLNWNGITE